MITRQEHKELLELCLLVHTCKAAKMSDTEIAREIIKKYGFYITQLTYDEYVAWLRSDRSFTRLYFEVVAEEAYVDIMKAGGIDIL